MKNKTIILTCDDETIAGTSKEQEYLKYAHKNNQNILGECHYPFEMSLIAPEKLVQAVMSFKPDSIIVDENYIFSDLYLDGKITRMFKERDVHILYTDERMTEIRESISEDDKIRIKEAVNYALKESGIEIEECLQRKAVAIVTRSNDTDEVKKLLEKFAMDDKVSSICVFEMEEFADEMKPVINKAIDDHNVREIVILDGELVNSALEEYMQELQSQRNIEVSLHQKLKMNYDESICFIC